jgi:ATP-dependent helicase HrpA
LDWLEQHPGSDAETLPDALGRALLALTGEVVNSEDWQLDRVPAHLRITYVVRAAGGVDQELAAARDLQELRDRLRSRMQRALDTAAADLTRSGARTWEFGEIAARVNLERDGHQVLGYPALVDEGSSVGLTICPTADQQVMTHALGLRRLVLLNTPDPTKWVIAHLGKAEKLALGTGPYASVPTLLSDALLASVGQLISRHQSGAVRDAGSFADLCDRVRTDNAEMMREITRVAAEICSLRGEILGALPRVRSISEAAAADIAEQVGNLVFAGFLGATSYEHLTDLPRYLRAARARIDTLIQTPTRDRAGFAVINRIEDAYAELCEQSPPGRLPTFVDDVGWLIEELRVSLFAQLLRTRVPVSEKRVLAAIDAARSRLQIQTTG